MRRLVAAAAAGSGLGPIVLSGLHGHSYLGDLRHSGVPFANPSGRVSPFANYAPDSGDSSAIDVGEGGKCKKIWQFVNNATQGLQRLSGFAEKLLFLPRPD